ncbi:DegQ family serine endoprotease [Sediminicurvatus halobius]|uniref:Serine endoprotease DegQ n=1 Tax=Sediminicurvatus halobius TaxID=2182432 RepID=A0A2U2N8L4_9GAMM|nr:DegQ family serine endoprotease [Spiribacter halobius]PWG65526.1 serine endoprotease DegQ [Spiribacter halobius]UEX76551.1 DegQ family serine endoprotease [Spiribacter halobius]
MCVRLFSRLAVGLLLMGGVATAGIPVVGQDGEVPSLAPLVDTVSPAVVNIATRSEIPRSGNPLLDDPFFRRFFDLPQPPRERPAQSLGSGVIVDAGAGYVLTNHHVVAEADEIRVGLQDGRELEATLIGSDPETDLAVLQVPAEGLTALPLGDSDRLRVGDYVMAIGNPFGLDHTVTTGVVSGLDRVLPGNGGARLQSFIQTDASINPGNSGGALVSLRGELVGINTAILSRGGGNIGIGFAIPSNMAQRVMAQIIEYGEVRRGVLGVRVQDLTPEIAQAFGLEQGGGALVAQVAPGSAAARAGLESGDVITAVNGQAINNANDLANAIGLLRVGTEVEITFLRDGRERRVTAVVEDPASGSVSAERLHPALAGARFSELDERSPLFGEVRGVLVTGVEPGSRAARYLREGDVILSVNREPVPNLAAFRRAVRGAERLLLNIRRGESAFFVLLR